MLLLAQLRYEISSLQGDYVELDEVVPWGRSLDEYREMFSLTNADLQRSILGCGDGPASFNAELTRLGGQVVSVDPIYVFSSEQIGSRVDAVSSHILHELSKNKNDYVWKSFKDVDSLGAARMGAMRIFLADFAKSQASGRYLPVSLPELPFRNKEFELALCSHYLFLYSEHVSLEEHISSVKELCRVADEVRVFPLLSISNNRESPHLPRVIEELEAENICASIVDVDYEFQRGASSMLVASNRKR